MKFDHLLDMLFELLLKRKLTAPYFAEKYEISVRTVYRYVDILSLSLPVEVQNGRNGGIYISDAYKLPVGYLTKEERLAADEALGAMATQLPEERFVKAREKLRALSRGNFAENAPLSGAGIFVDGGTWGDTRAFSEKLSLFETAVKNRSVIQIVYYSRGGERTARLIEPHLLVYKQNVWYVYAYCRKQNDFRLFRVGRVHSAFLTGETFTQKEVRREDLPLHFWQTAQPAEVLLKVSQEAFADVQDWLGCESFLPPDVAPEKNAEKNAQKTPNETAENQGETQNARYAAATLPFDETLVKKIVSLGAGVKVVSPESLKKQVQSLAAAVAARYADET